MNKFSLTKLLFAMMLVMLLALAGCGTDDSDDTSGDSEETDPGTGEEEEVDDGIYSIEDFSPIKTNEGEAIEGGILNFGLVTDTAFEGTLNYNFYSGTYDAEIIDWFDESLLAVDENYAYTQEGAATFEINEEEDSITFTIGDNVNWHDGEPVTAEDWLFSYEVIADPEYDGVRYGNMFTIIEGMAEYNSEEADTISGMEIIDEKTLKITYDQFTPSLLASGIWAYAMPKHIFEDIPVADMAASDAVRQEPIGMGPFKVESIVPGESVTYVKNADYWRGEPTLDGVSLRVINPNVVVQALQNGDVDMVHSFPTDQYPDNADMSNVEYLGDIDNAYTYIGFKLGAWDEETSSVVMDPDAKMADLELRKAMWHAVDNDAIGQQFYNGLRWNATTLIPPSHPDFHDGTIEAPLYDEDLANEILDEAGYEDVTGDGFREDRDGNELVITFASMSGGDTAEPLASYYMQSWAEIGLNVELLDGRLTEFNSFYERVQADDPDIDIFQGAWGVGSDVDPSGLYGPNAVYNFSRYLSEENDALLAEGLSDEAFDQAYRQDVYSRWQELMVEEIPVFPTVYRAALIPINNRVVNYSMATNAGSGIYLYEIGLTQEEPFTH